MTATQPVQPIVTDDQEIDILRLFWTLWEGKWKIAITTVVFIALAATYSIITPPSYKVTSIWLPQLSASGGSMGQIAGLAGLMGVNLGGQSSNIEVYYPQIVSSRAFLEKIIDKKWPTISGDSMYLQQIYQMDTNTFKPQLPNVTKTQLMRNSLIDLIREAVVYETSAQANMLTVTSADPVVASEINKYILAQLKAYAEESKIRNTMEERDFYQSKYLEYKDSLSRAESRLLNFRLRNLIISSPSQMMEEERLKQESTLISSMVLEFRQQSEMAQISLTKKLSDFQMLQEPVPPTSKFAPKRKIIVAVGLIAGVMFGSFLTLVLAWWNRRKNEFSKN